MKYSCLALITLCMMGCGGAAKKPIDAKPDARHYIHCKEISVDAKTGATTIVCPRQEKEK